MEDGQATVGVSVAAHHRLDAVVTMAIGRDLQGAVLVTHRVGFTYDPLLRNAQRGMSEVAGFFWTAVRF